MGDPSIAQVTSVSELSDVQPTDWAFSALQSLVERYSCIEGYPDRTYRGQRALSRYEFAAGLNACLDKMNEVISAGLADKVSKDDLATLQRLQEEFAAELAALKGRVDSLDQKVATLEKQQFSTTTKLAGNVIFAPIALFGDNPRTEGGENLTFAYRARLNFNTSFTGKDLLRVRLQAANIPNLSTPAGTNTTRLGFDTNTSGNFGIDDLYYRFPWGNATVIVGTNAMNVDKALDPIHPSLASSDTGALSRFGDREPLLFRGQEGAGGGISLKFSDSFTLNTVYVANNGGGAAANPSAGLFGGGYTAGAQLVFKPSKTLTLGLGYTRGFNPTSGLGSGTGTALANAPFGNNVPINSDRYGAQVNFDLSPTVTIHGSVGFANARQSNGNGSADLVSWFTSISLKDLFGTGNLGALIVGQPPRVVGSNVSIPADTQNPFHIEALYRYRVSRNISITPGVVAILNPGVTVNNAVRNETIFVGVVRTSFSF
jgi:hypothetical protein